MPNSVSVSTITNGSGYNLNTWRVILNSIGLRDFNGNLFTISTSASFDTAVSSFDSWLAGASGTNMSYMLSAQLAGMKLNVSMAMWNSFGGVNPNSLIYAPGTNSANANGFATVWASTQGQFTAELMIAAMLDLPASRLKVVPVEIGGGFGGKICIHGEAVAVRLAQKSQV